MASEATDDKAPLVKAIFNLAGGDCSGRSAGPCILVQITICVRL